MSLVCNVKEAARFLRMLGVNKEDTTFQFTLIHEIPDKDGNKKIIQQLGKLSAVEDTLCDFNERKYGIYVTVNQTKSVKRTAADITLIRAVWHDDDGGASIPDLEPSITIETSPGKHHRYWLLEDGLLPDHFKDWKAFMKRFATKYEADKSATDLSRVMRLPGFNHQKDADKPFLVRIVGDVTVETVKRYTFDEVLQMAPPETHTSNSDTRGEDDDSRDPDDWIDEIINGKDWHENLNSLAFSFVNRGYSNKFAIKTLQALMNDHPDKGTQRWQARYNDIKRAVDTAREKYNYEQDDGVVTEYSLVKGKPYLVDIKRPPGKMGSIVEWMETQFRYPCPTLAIVGALHVINTYAGNYYTFDDAPNHRKTIILARQGRGKNTIAKILARTNDAMLKKHSQSALFVKFIGSPDFTSARNIHLELQEWGSRSLIMPEAGHAKGTKAGDIARLVAYENQVLANPPSHYTVPPKQNQQRGDTKTIGLRAICLSIIQESVPDNYAKLLADYQAFSDGTLSRANFIFVDGFDPDGAINSEKVPCPDWYVELCYRIADNCASKGDITHRVINPDTHEVECDPAAMKLFDKTERECLRIQKEYEDDPVMCAIHIRKVMKAKSTARLLAIADNYEHPRVTLEHAEWALYWESEIEQTTVYNTNAGVLADAADKFVDLAFKKLKVYMSDANQTNTSTFTERKYNYVEGERFMSYVMNKKIEKELRQSPDLRHLKRKPFYEELLGLLCSKKAGMLRKLDKKGDGKPYRNSTDDYKDYRVCVDVSTIKN